MYNCLIMTEEQKYLKEGEQTKVTPLVKKHAEKAKQIQVHTCPNLGENLVLAQKVAKYIFTELPKIQGYKSHPSSKEEVEEQRVLKDSIYTKRTADQILSEGYYPTCSDIGVLFRTLLIALDVPTGYVITLHEEYLLNKSFFTHSIGKVFSEGKWYYVDPGAPERKITENREDLFPLIVYSEGLDSWDLGIRGYEDLHTAKQNNLRSLLEEYKRILGKKISNADMLLQASQLIPEK